jgi:hypothetical protein
MGKLSSRYANKAAKIASARLAALSNSLGLNQAALVAIDRSTSLPASWFYPDGNRPLRYVASRLIRRLPAVKLRKGKHR